MSIPPSLASFLDRVPARCSLKVKPRADLADPGVARRRDLAELAAADISGRVVEQGVIEDIKEFGSDLNSR